MKKVIAFRMGLFVVSFLLVLSCRMAQQSFTDKPNVIILVSDDQGYGDLSCHGNPYLKTPNLDKLYRESIRFTDFHTSAICTPTRSQLMTGIDAVRNGAYNYGFGKTNIFHSYPDTVGHDHEIHLMSEFFKANGYRTGHFGKWHLGDFFPFRSMDRGFDTTFTYPGASVWQTPNYWNNDCFDDVYLSNGRREKTKGYCTDVWFTKTIRFIKEAVAKDEPFFVYLPTSAMHTPQFVPAKYLSSYKNLPALTAQFFGMIANFDENVGRLDAALESLNVKDNTLLLYFSDNGGTMGVSQYNAGMRGKKGSFYDGGHRVPCFLRWPKGIQKTNRDVDDMVIVQDIMPTLIDLCQLEMPWKQRFDGVNLSDLIKGKKQDLSNRMSVVQFSTKSVGLNGSCVLWNKWRLVNGDELYDISTDRAQKKNVALEFPEVVQKMRDYYATWSRGVEPSLAKHSEIKIGYPGFESLALTCFDWLEIEGKGNPSQQNDIRQGMEMHGSWNIKVVEKGIYELTFRRWPEEVNCAIRSGLPPYFSEFSKQIGCIEVPSNEVYQNFKTICPGGVYPEGKALPITKIRFSSNEIRKTRTIAPEDRSATFVIEFAEGQNKLQGDFLDEEGNVLCGAYYVDIKRVDNL